MSDQLVRTYGVDVCDGFETLAEVTINEDGTTFLRVVILQP